MNKKASWVRKIGWMCDRCGHSVFELDIGLPPTCPECRSQMDISPRGVTLDPEAVERISELSGLLETPIEITIEITQRCPEGCDYCSSRATMDSNVMLTVEDVMEIFDSVQQQVGMESIGRINISGGEPLSHPDFFEIKRFCDIIGRENVYVYTNAISNLIYNTTVIKDGVEIHANVVLIPGRAANIPKRADMVHLLKLVKQGRAEDLDVPDLDYHVSKNILEKECSGCNHILIQADGKVRIAPCKKEYDLVDVEGEFSGSVGESREGHVTGVR